MGLGGCRCSTKFPWAGSGVRSTIHTYEKKGQWRAGKGLGTETKDNDRKSGQYTRQAPWKGRPVSIDETTWFEEQ